MSKLAGLLIVPLFLIAAGISVVPGQTRKDLNGQTFEFKFLTGYLAGQEMRAAIREFVWNSWVNKRRTTIRSSQNTIDSFPVVTEILVRKDSKGAWYVEVVSTQRLGCFGLRKELIEHFRSYQVDRVEVVSFDSSGEIPTPIGSEIKRDPKLYRVRLRADIKSDDFIF